MTRLWYSPLPKHILSHNVILESSRQFTSVVLYSTQTTVTVIKLTEQHQFEVLSTATRGIYFGIHDIIMTWTIASKLCLTQLISPQCHIYASMDWVAVGSGNGLSPVRHQAITWTNAGLLSIGLIRTYFSEIWIGIVFFSFNKMHLKMSSDKMAAILSRGDDLLLSVTGKYPQPFFRSLSQRPEALSDLIILILSC